MLKKLLFIMITINLLSCSGKKASNLVVPPIYNDIPQLSNKGVNKYDQ